MSSTAASPPSRSRQWIVLACIAGACVLFALLVWSTTGDEETILGALATALGLGIGAKAAAKRERERQAAEAAAAKDKLDQTIKDIDAATKRDVEEINAAAAARQADPQLADRERTTQRFGRKP